MEIGKKIKELRTQKGISQTELAKAIGYDNDTPVSKSADGFLKATAFDPAYGTVNDMVAYFPATRNQEPYGTCWAFSYSFSEIL